jgi:hypothetical protein
MRNYKREYKLFHSQPIQKKRRAGRNHARRIMIKLGKVRKYSSMDIEHKNNNTLDNRLSNLKVMSKHKNRSIK